MYVHGWRAEAAQEIPSPQGVGVHAAWRSHREASPTRATKRTLPKLSNGNLVDDPHLSLAGLSTFCGLSVAAADQ